ncbi:spotted leaf protein, putative [Medicago truncatula]|uniref:Spotted leaf protein, putative n=1 Tax=Medicago truncatula TaxID=3880 RepID=A0A072VGK1_MEDTR|nr:spotted leaf protein, putative [Medicago truncatula]
MEKILEVAKQTERNRTCMVKVGVTKTMIMVIKKKFKQGNTIGLEEALKITRLLWNEATINNSVKLLVGKNMDFMNLLTWILKIYIDNNNFEMVNEVMPVLKLTIDVVDSNLLRNLNIEFFITFSKQAIKSVLHVLIETCPFGWKPNEDHGSGRSNQTH